MGNVRIDLNFDSISDQFGLFKQEVEQELNMAAKNLANMTYAFLLEMVQNELHSTRKTYIDALTPFKEVAPGTFICTLDTSAMFIEEGLPQNFDMKPGLLKNAIVGKGGTRYKVIPFEHNLTPQDRTAAASNLRDAMQDRYKMKFGKQANLFAKRKDGAGNVVGGQTIRNTSVGGPVPGKGNTPVGQNINAYQNVTGENKKGKKTGTLSVKTFRTVTSGPASNGKWIHPGLDAKKFFDRAADRAQQIWDTQILPEALKNLETWGKWK